MSKGVARNDAWKSWVLFIIGCIIIVAVSVNFIINATVLFIGIVFLNAGLQMQGRPQLSYYIAQIPLLSRIVEAFCGLFR